MAGYRFLKRSLGRRRPEAEELLRELEAAGAPSSVLEATARDLLFGREGLARARAGLLLSEGVDGYELEAFSMLCCALRDLVLAFFGCLWALRQLCPSTVETLAEGLGEGEAEVLGRMLDLALSSDLMSSGSLPGSFAELLSAVRELCSFLLGQTDGEALLELFMRREPSERLEGCREALLQRAKRSGEELP